MATENLKPSVLIVEDDDAIVTMLTFNLERAGFDTRVTDDGDEVLLMIAERKPDVILLDWMLPGMSGIELCERIRKKEATSKIPIIMISARGDEGDRIEGLERGVDDYLVKPFSPKELIARINAVFRRVRPAFVAKSLSYGDIDMDLTAKTVRFCKKEIHLGPLEYKLLQSLLEYPRRVLSREQLIRRVWGNELYVEPRTVDVHINRLRKSLGLGQTGTVIRTIRSSGYCLKNSGEEDESEVKDSEIMAAINDVGQ